MLYRLSYERIFSDLQILPNNITTPAPKKQEESAKKCLWQPLLLSYTPRNWLCSSIFFFFFIPHPEETVKEDYIMANIKVTSKQDAWNKVNQIFPHRL